MNIRTYRPPRDDDRAAACLASRHAGTTFVPRVPMIHCRLVDVAGEVIALMGHVGWRDSAYLEAVDG